MKLRKLNKTPWLSLCLVAMLVLGCLVMAVGPALARYRVDNRGTEDIQARPLEQIYLGQMVKVETDLVSALANFMEETDESEPTENTETPEIAQLSEEPEERMFDHESRSAWQRVDGVSRLDFAVANGKLVTVKDETTGAEVTEPQFAQGDQQVMLQLVGSLGVWNGQDEFVLTLKAPSRVKLGEFEEITATVQRIDPESLLYRNFGDGWIFTFLDEKGEPLSWTLEGGKFSVLELQLTLQGVIPDDMSRLLLQITGDYTKK